MLMSADSCSTYESPVIFCFTEFMHFLRQPSCSVYFSDVKFRDIRLDVQKGCAVYHIYTSNIQLFPFDSDETYYGDTDWVRASRCPRCKDSAQLIIHVRLHFQSPPPGQVEKVYQENVRKAFNVLETFDILWEYVDSPLDIPGGCCLYGCTVGLFERRMNDSDWLAAYFSHGVMFFEVCVICAPACGILLLAVAVVKAATRLETVREQLEKEHTQPVNCLPPKRFRAIMSLETS